ncbi:MAG: dihydrofolate reductase family protein [Vicinamibacterales bacterium]
MTSPSRVTIHMVASLDGFIARRDGGVDWLETVDRFEGGVKMTPELVKDVLASIDCYVMGSHTYELALQFEAKGMGWVYGRTPTVVLTSRALTSTRDTVRFFDGDVAELLMQLRATHRGIWVVGGGAVCGDVLRRGLADEVRYSIVPIAIGDGVPFFAGLDRDVPLHLVESTAYVNGMVALRYEVRRPDGA